MHHVRGAYAKGGKAVTVAPKYKAGDTVDVYGHTVLGIVSGEKSRYGFTYKLRCCNCGNIFTNNLHNLASHGYKRCCFSCKDIAAHGEESKIMQLIKSAENFRGERLANIQRRIIASICYDLPDRAMIEIDEWMQMRKEELRNVQSD
jgi:hypothetical protein